MKFNKLLIALALCAAMQPGISFSSAVPQSQSYYQQYAPQFMQDTTGYISKQARSAYDTVNSWSTQKKVAVASAIITALAAVYNRDQIMQWVSDILSQEARFARQQDSLFDEYLEVLVNAKRAQDAGDREELNKQRKLEGVIRLKLEDFGRQVKASGMSPEQMEALRD